MAKGSGGTRASSASAPKGQSANAKAAQTIGFGSVSSEQKMSAYIQKRNQITKSDGKDGWKKSGIGGTYIGKELNGSIAKIGVRLKSDAEGNSYFTPSIGSYRDNMRAGGVDAIKALRDTVESKRFQTLAESIKFVEGEAEKFNKKWK